MDFDFKKARKNKQSQDKARSTHRHHPDQKSKQSHGAQSSGVKGHATPLKQVDKPASYTETDPAQFQHLKRETEDITASTETKSYSRRVIVSNWERYELPPDFPEEQIEQSFDFETLINSLSDVKGHLKLSHEQNWGSERSELQEAFFNIDIHKLSASLERISFHSRQNLPTFLFTTEQLGIFEDDAEKAHTQSCLLKIVTKEDNVSQKLPATSNIPSAKAIDQKCPSDLVLAPVPEKSPIMDDVDVANVFQESSTTVTSSQSAEKSYVNPPVAGKPTERVSMSSPKTDELDLDFLLSLDTPVADNPQHVGSALTMSAAVGSKGSEAVKLDDWLDDLID